MKKFLLLLTMSIVLLFAFSTMALASSFEVEDKTFDDTFNPEDYDVYTFKFKTYSEVEKSSADKNISDLKQSLQKEKEKNIKSLVKEVKAMDLNGLGESARDALLAEVQQLEKKEQPYFETYTIYVPRSEVYYGTYNGYDFKQLLFESGWQNHLITLYNQSAIQDWADLLTDLLLDFTVGSQFIYVGAEIFADIFGYNWTVSYGDYVQVNLAEYPTNRIILIEDQQNYFPGDDFIPVLQHEKKEIKPTVFYRFNEGSGYLSDLEKRLDPEVFYSRKYNDSRTSHMQEAYGLYSAWQGNYMEVYDLPSPTQLVSIPR